MIFGKFFFTRLFKIHIGSVLCTEWSGLRRNMLKRNMSIQDNNCFVLFERSGQFLRIDLPSLYICKSTDKVTFVS